MKQSIEESNRHKALSSKVLDFIYGSGDKEMFAHQVVCTIQLMGGWKANIPFNTAMDIGNVIYDHYGSIKGGTAVFEDIIDDIHKSTDENAISATAKVCHIINPKAFPFIKDRHINKLFHCMMTTDYDVFVDEGRKYCLSHGIDMKRIGTYDLDSELWYKQMHNLF